MDLSQDSSDSGGSVPSKPTSFTIAYEARQRVIRGHLQLLRDSEISIVKLLHLVPASRIEMAKFHRGTGRTARPQSQLKFLDTNDSDESDDGLPEVSVVSVVSRHDFAVNDDMKEDITSTMPTKLIIKSFKDEVFYDIEVEAYRKMSNIQGTAVPEFYGTGMLNGLPTIVLEYIAGNDLYSYQSDIQRLPALARAVVGCARLVAECGVAQMDPRLDGILVTDSPGLTVKMIDFSHVDFDTFYTSSVNQNNSYELMSLYAELMGWEMPEDVSTW
ncbi:uncharacterized protein K489DRAFT_411812 [Dissoconium aciculare CBS 342.82]|uniref:Protein kinase domain-containing protein n=1 Tax=Dissoconium aciculare CBS 342.82 TaxID=1314786 RepID=A0A6J3LZ64_9PEZI|nr:uncharacterized protein K489DRAFT_411812 [Dissoconium aciculare CBS 342.82]KAF1820569.1 hypothetical protein K489DRAFT_411812 [Dissoconium aciculare CBS 342.82]